jgi:hypothetical protein
MKQKAFVTGALIVGVILLVGAAIGVPSVFGSTKNLTTLSADEVLDYRWKAMADYYGKLSARDLTTLSAEEALDYRWKAMADYYSRLSARDLTTLSADEILDFRWKALVEFYSTTGAGR